MLKFKTFTEIIPKPLNLCIIYTFTFRLDIKTKRQIQNISGLYMV